MSLANICYAQGCRCLGLGCNQGLCNNIYAYYCDNKKPYKCPVCDGDGNKHNARWRDGHMAMQALHNQEKTQVAPCNACEGKGIVWG